MCQWVLVLAPFVPRADLLLDSLILVSNALRSAIEHSSHRSRGRPSINISEEQLLFFVQHGFKSHRNSTIVWLFVERRMQHCEISVHSSYSRISDSDLQAIVATLCHRNPNIGKRSIDGLLRAQGIIVQRHRIRDTLHAVDPEGVHNRLRGIFHRRQYSVPSPNALWHVNGYHKLIRWRIVVYGGIAVGLLPTYKQLPTILLEQSYQHFWGCCILWLAFTCPHR